MLFILFLFEYDNLTILYEKMCPLYNIGAIIWSCLPYQNIWYLQIIIRQLIFKIQISRSSMSEQIIKFLNKFTISHIDDHTSIISEYQHPIDYGNQNKYQDQSSLSFLITDSRKYKNASPSTTTPACYLVKDLIIDDQNQLSQVDTQAQGSNKKLQAALETLSMHQQLSNKYILTLVHYQVFKKLLPNTNNMSSHVVSNYQQQNLTENQSLAHFPLGLHREKQKIIKTRVEEASYNEQSGQGDSFVQNYSRDKSITHFSQCNNQNRSNNAHLNTNANVQTTMKANVSLNVASNELHTAIRAIYEYGKITLKQEIKNRIISNTQFQQEQLWAILATLVQALSYLQQEGIVYGVLGTDKIFINNSLVKILDPSATATDPLLIAQGRLYSPEILNDQENIDMFKSDVYIIGMVLLECSLLINLSKDPQPNINKYLISFREVYSQQLVDIVRLCLAADPKDRPTFQDLKQYLAKQLDMNDFQSAYDNTGARILQPLPADHQDSYNPLVNEIQIEYQQDQHDVLYQSIGEDQLKSRRKNMTEYERARMKYLGLSVINQMQNGSSGSSSDRKSRQKQNRMQSQQNKHRYTSSSPLQTKKNSKLPHDNSCGYFNFNNVNHGKTNKALPNLNMAISQSIYPESQNMNANTQKTNRKYHKKAQKEDELNWAHQRQKGHQKTVPNSNEKQKQKLTKTKEIKQKLVKMQNVENNPNDQTFGNKTRKENTTGMNNKQKPKIKPQIYNQYNMNANMNKLDNSQIREEAEQQSESSYIYYNHQNHNNSNSNSNSNSNNSNKVLRNKNNQNSIGNSQVSRNSQLSNSNGNLSSNRMMLKNSNRYKHSQYQEQLYRQDKQNNQNTYSSTNCTKLLKKIEEDQLFTDPNLLKTIKDDLARISTKKIRLMGQLKDRERERERDRERQREKQKYFH